VDSSEEEELLVWRDLPADDQALSPARLLAEPADVAALDGCLAEWALEAPAEAAPAASWLRAELRSAAAATQAAQSPARAGSERAARGEWSGPVIVALLSSAGPWSSGEASEGRRGRAGRQPRPV
jgi:hypothetical protein